MGCGVLFPRDFECKSDSEGEGELIARVVEDRDWEKLSRAGDQVNAEAEEYETDSGEEDDWWRPEVRIGDKVQVRHLETIGQTYIFGLRCISREMERLLGRRMWYFPVEAFIPQLE